MEFKDRSGKVIHPGDIVQYQLGTFAKKSGGPTRYKVAKSKKGLVLQFWFMNQWTDQRLLRTDDQQRISIIDTSERTT